MTLRLLLYSITLGILLSGCHHQPSESREDLPLIVKPSQNNIKVLFLGNSYTYYNALPKVFAKLSSLNGKKATVKTIARGGVRLTDHSKNESLESLIRREAFDWIVLQEQSTTPLTNQSQMFNAIRSLHHWSKAKKSNLLLFLFWAREYSSTLNVKLGDQKYFERFSNSEEAQSTLTRIHKMIADEIKCEIAPVGNVWQQVHNKNHRLQLWESDRSHPTKVGSYITAMVFYTSIYNALPIRHLATCPLNHIELGLIEKIIRRVVLERNSFWNDLGYKGLFRR